MIKGIKWVGVIVLWLAISVAFYLSSPEGEKEERLLDGLINTYLEDSIEREVTIYFTDIKAHEENDLRTILFLNMLDDLKIVLTYRGNQETKEFETLWKASLQETLVAEGRLYSNQDSITFDFPTLYEKPIRLNWESIDTVLGIRKPMIEDILSDIKNKLKVGSYGNINHFEGKRYADLLKAFFLVSFIEEPKTEEINIDGHKIKAEAFRLETNRDALITLMEDILHTILTDKKIENIMLRDGVRFLFDENTIRDSKIEDMIDLNIHSELYINKDDLFVKENHIFKTTLKNVFQSQLELNINCQVVVKNYNEKLEFIPIEADVVDISEYSPEERIQFLKDIERSLFSR